VGGLGRREVVLTVGDYGALDDGAEQVLTLGETQAFETTTDGINQTETCGLPCKVRLDLVVVHVVRDVLDDLVGLGTDGRLSVVGGHGTDRQGGGGGRKWGMG
jgi:hypothetical protein